MTSSWQQYLHKQCEAINKYASLFCYILLVIITAVTVMQIGLRFIFNNPTSWSEEIALLCLVWFGLIAIAIGIRRHEHIAIMFVRDLCPLQIARALDYSAQVLMAIFMTVVLFNGFSLSSLISEQLLPASQLPKSWLYLPLFFSGLLGLFNAGCNILLKDLKESADD
ncbi:MAG: TRAP transporter small permease [Kordiimonadaceae bacterium]|jgi:TRAP-type transport system small permease protein|nr:TRAP transporter small permease [Kordiimonadaceae bacterium]MBT6032556.1 TRAP transporter small permease [Kordiimonadaceae bacterium]